jgi:predicted Rdx family selenoprotein
LGYEVKFIGGYGGIYDIKMDEKMIFSKDQSKGRFPKKGEIVELLRQENA